jgi:hypothetical protein
MDVAVGCILVKPKVGDIMNDWMDEARQMVGQCENQEDVARLVANWMDTAAQNLRNTDFYRNLLVKCAENLGPLKHKAYIQDDGGVVDSPLALKIPGLVAELAKAAGPFVNTRDPLDLE